LLFFYGLTRNREDVAATGVDGARDFTVVRDEESQHAVFKLQLGIAAAKLDAGTGVDLVHSGSVGLRTIEGSEDFARLARRRLLRQRTAAENRDKQSEEEGPGFHAGSVVR
jgi:hypothetical protein